MVTMGHGGRLWLLSRTQVGVLPHEGAQGRNGNATVRYVVNHMRLQAGCEPPPPAVDRVLPSPVWRLALRVVGRGHVDRTQKTKAMSIRKAIRCPGDSRGSDAEQCLSYTGMLVEHFNAHVRYGAAMALGISCAGSGYKVGF
ncbi:unnamed protein product [Toxocara canis]|uniref:26S proteasome non-ATPase regulatory subunit 1 n=1 Tax=Toxocara canis TaxID=6265 RepID=A0A183UGF9_TOXCA|nr:unnamed protein product [Toxocara canis]